MAEEQTTTTTTTSSNEENATPKAAFKSFQTQEEYDNFCAHMKKKYIEEGKNSVATTDDGKVDIAKERQKAIDEARAYIEEQAVQKYIKEQNMTEEEKRAEMQKELETKLREQQIALNKREAELVLKQAGFDSNAIQEELNYVTEEREASLGRITSLVKSRKAMEDTIRKQVMAELGVTTDVQTGVYAGLTKEKAEKMSLSERNKLYKENHDLYVKFFSTNK